MASILGDFSCYKGISLYNTSMIIDNSFIKGQHPIVTIMVSLEICEATQNLWESCDAGVAIYWPVYENIDYLNRTARQAIEKEL